MTDTNPVSLTAATRPVSPGDTVFTWSGHPTVAYETKVIKVRDEHGFALLEYHAQEQDLDGVDYPFLSRIRTHTNLLYATAEEALADAAAFDEILNRAYAASTPKS